MISDRQAVLMQADTIRELHTNLAAMQADLRKYCVNICLVCKHEDAEQAACRAMPCREGDKWVWRGVQEGGEL